MTVVLLGQLRADAGQRLRQPLSTSTTGSTRLPAYLLRLEWDAIGRLHQDHLTALTPAERVLGVHTYNSTRLLPIEIGRHAPFVFSECARYFGPIHTDIKIASDEGLPGLILHGTGTGTIAYALSSLTNHEAGGDPTRVRGLEVRLRGMVLCPSVMTLRVFAGAEPNTYHFDALTESGSAALADGVLILS